MEEKVIILRPGESMHEVKEKVKKESSSSKKKTK